MIMATPSVAKITAIGIARPRRRLSSPGRPNMPPPMMQLITRAAIVQRPIERMNAIAHLTQWEKCTPISPSMNASEARVCGDEAEVRICEATLSRTEEECHPTVRGVRAGESVLGAEKTVALGTGLARERRLLITGEPPKQAEDRKKPNPSACTGLAEHLLPRRHELIQSFPRVAPDIPPFFNRGLGFAQFFLYAHGLLP